MESEPERQLLYVLGWICWRLLSTRDGWNLHVPRHSISKSHLLGGNSGVGPLPSCLAWLGVCVESWEAGLDGLIQQGASYVLT